jgi:hypothetical protein
MKSILSLLFLIAVASAARADDTPLYVGSWSNGRGETLVITSKTMQFGDDRPFSFRDVTRVSDGESYELQITTRGEINGFPGKTLHLTFEEGAMEMTGYKSHAEFMQGGDVQMQVTWYKDSADADDE